MKTNMMLGLALASLLVLAPLAVQAEVLTITPTQAVVCPDDETGVTKVAVAFDLSRIRSGEGRVIDEALLDWPVNGVPSDHHTEYTLHAATSTWTSGEVAGSTVPAFSETPIASWDYDALDYQRNQGGLLRFNLCALVRGWLAGEPNYGVVIVTEDLAREGLSNQLGNIRLTVRYGFID